MSNLRKVSCVSAISFMLIVTTSIFMALNGYKLTGVIRNIYSHVETVIITARLIDTVFNKECFSVLHFIQGKYKA